MVNDFIFELGLEELPSASVLPLAQALAEGITQALQQEQIPFGSIRYFATPRRLAVSIADVQEEQPTQTIMRRGPAVAQAYDKEEKPTQALLGFARSCQVSIEDLRLEKTEKGEWFVYESSKPGEKTTAIIPRILHKALENLPIAKTMRWGEGELEFVRPAHWALLLWGDSIIECDILGVKTGNLSYGHRFHHPQAILIKHASNYEESLKKAYVIADFSKRRNTIIQQVKDKAGSKSADALMPDDLLDEVTSIVEWPQALVADFDPAFLEVPAEALIASMQAHQKCFALQNSEGHLLPHFVTVANIASTNPQQVIMGNEKVMRARLSDAAFFFHQDKKFPLERLLPATDKVVFQEKLGTLLDKSKRLQQIMGYLSPHLDLDEDKALRAAFLSKCDLLTGMVGEFPELQGLMGYYYACHDGEAMEVAHALNEQYMPRFAADALPNSSLGLALSLADRLDTLVGIFAIGQKPSGVKDPFKLRRHALAVVRLLLNTDKPVSLEKLLAFVSNTYDKELSICPNVMAELKHFILDRLQSYYLNLSFSSDLVNAVRARQDDWLYDFDKRIHALRSFVLLPESLSLSQACKRVTNVLQQANLEHVVDPDATLFQESAESDLFSQLEKTQALIQPLIAKAEYDTILQELAGLREVIDTFFDKVMVMVEDETLRKNRLYLLGQMQKLLQSVADISLLQLSP